MSFTIYKPFKLQTILLAVMVCLLCTTSYAQTASFKNYSVKDGLPSSEVYNCLQDSKGYMWFATDKGVSRFDGYRFHNYSTADGLADNTIFECIEDIKGRIWFRSFSGKLSYYYNDSIYNLSVNDALNKILKTSSITSLASDSNNNIYIGLYAFTEGILKIDLRKKSIEHVRMPFSKTYTIFVDGRLVFGNTFNNQNGLSTINPTYYTNLNLYKPSQGVIKHIKSYQNTLLAGVQIHDQVIAISKSKLAILSCRRLEVFDTNTSVFNLVKDFKTADILSLKSTETNTFWLSTRDSVFFFDGVKLISDLVPAVICHKQVTSVLKDKEGGIWVTTLNGGVYYANSISFVNYNDENGLSNNKVVAFDIASNGDVLVATEESKRVDVISKNVISHLPEAKYNAISIKIDSLENIWVGYNDGLSVYDKDFSNIMHLTDEEYGGIKGFLFNKDSTCWVNKYSKLCLVKQKGHYLTLQNISVLNSKIFNIEKDIDGSIWLGTLRGLFHYKNDTVYNMGDKFPILKNRINDLKIIPQSNDLWMATRDTGILIKHGDNIIRISTSDGLLSNFCQCICTDYLGNMWVGTNIGISHIVVNKKDTKKPVDTIINITTPGLLEVNGIKTRGDTVYVGSTNGITLFDTKRVSSNRVPPSVYITGIKINNQNKYVSSAYTLKYDENYLIINFVGLTYKDAGNTQYRYKMEGIDTGWVYTKNRDVQYPKLPPGNYTFLVSAMNNDGVWNQHPASVRFYISPPFWATWWARSLFILAIAGFIFWRFRIVTNRAKKEAEINKHLISMELKELKAQMDPHFLFNNLNTLTQLVEIKSDDAPEFVEELSRYYRYSLQFRNTEFTTLDNELKQAERYLHILKIRFGDNIHVTWNVNDEFKNYYIATYSMQLLLENITKHNIVSASKPIWVNINTNTNGYLEVKNQYQPKNSSALSNKHGLKSIDQRYQLLISKNINVTQNSEVFSVQLPLISPTQYESIYS